MTLSPYISDRRRCRPRTACSLKFASARNWGGFELLGVIEAITFTRYPKRQATPIVGGEVFSARLAVGRNPDRPPGLASAVYSRTIYLTARQRGIQLARVPRPSLSWLPCCHIPPARQFPAHRTGYAERPIRNPSFRIRSTMPGCTANVATATTLRRYWSVVSCWSIQSARSALEVNRPRMWVSAT